MSPLRVSPIDASRGADSSTIATVQSHPAVASREAQQRFERLMQGEPKPSTKSNDDGKNQPPGKAVDPSSRQAYVDERLGKIPAQPESAEDWNPQQQLTEQHQSDLADSDPCDQPTGMCQDASASHEAYDARSADQSSSRPDEMRAAEPQTTSPLPTPLELVSRTSGTPAVYSKPTEPVAHASTRLLDLARTVADRILVSDSAKIPQEVHIQVKETILPGTEIRLSEQAGSLQVRMLTNQPASLEFLTQQQAALSAQLELALARPVVVQVDFDSLSQFSSHQQSESQSQSNSQSNSQSHDSGYGHGHEPDNESGREHSPPMAEQGETDAKRNGKS